MLQRRAVRIILNVRRGEVVFVGRLNIMHLKTRRSLHLIKHVKWIVDNGIYADNRKISTRAHAGNRRNQRIQVPKSTMYLKLSGITWMNASTPKRVVKHSKL